MKAESSGSNSESNSGSNGAVDRLMWVTRQLRRYCPWTRGLAHAELTEYLIEEAYETVEVIEADGDYDELRKEFGDVLFQVVLHSAIAEQQHGFSLETVAEAITAKMVRRNPHVFTPNGELLDDEQLGQASLDDVEKNWERIKQTERGLQRDSSTVSTLDAGPDAGAGARESIFAIPTGLPALAAAAKVIDRAARQPVNPLPEPAADTESETLEVSETSESSGSSGRFTVDLADEERLGADLFELVRRARGLGLDPERALRMHLNQQRSR